MKKKLCCILMLIILLLNSSILLIISEAVDAVQTLTEEEKIKALAEINLIKYENYDTTTENSESGSKGVLAQFNLKTGIEFAEGEEYKPIQKTNINIALPMICNYRPSRVEVIVKSTQATNGGKDAEYEYHSSTGILSIISDNSTYTQKIEDARDEYEIICIYRSECYTDNQENSLKIQLNMYETLQDEENTIISSKLEEQYSCKDTVGGIISIEHETEDIYDGYIKANSLNNENKYETMYNEKLKVMISNKDIVEKIEVKEISEKSLYMETVIDKNQILDIIGENGSINIIDEESNILKTINKDSETDENGKIKITYKNRVNNLIFQLKNLEKEGTIELENKKVIEPTTEIIENIIPTQVYIKGINTIVTEVNKDDGVKENQLEEIVKYEKQEQNEVKIKNAVSEIETKLSNDILVNNTKNEVILTVSLKADEPKYSLFKNPTISIEMPKEVKRINMETPEFIYNNKVFEIISSNISENESGNKVINIQLQGEQIKYEQASIVEGTNIRIPLTIYLTKQMSNKVENIKFTYFNENTSIVESRKMEVSLLNKVVDTVPEVYKTAINEESETTNILYEQDGIKAEITQEVGGTAIANNSIIYEQQIVKQIIKVTNSGKTSKKVSLTVDIPDEMTYVKLQTGGYIKNEEKGYYVYSDRYRYEEQEEKEVKIDLNVGAGETKTEYIELKVNDLQNDVEEKQITTINDLKIDEKTVKQYNIQNTVKQAQISASLKCVLGIQTRKEWTYKLEIKNLTDKEIKNVNVSFAASEFFNIEEVKSGTGENIGKIEENIWTYTIDTLKPIKMDEKGRYEEGYVECYIDGQVGEINESEYCGYEINGVAKVYGDDIPEYFTNETRMTGYLEAVEITMQADKEILKKDEEVTYTVEIKNIGKTFGGFGIYTSINVKDIIPRELKPISVKYNYFDINKEMVQDETYPEWIHEVQSYTEKEETKDLTILDIPDGYDYTDAPNIDLNLNIPEGETITIIIKAEATMLSEKTDITNIITAKGDYIKTKTAKVANTILNYDYSDSTDTIEPPDPVDPPGSEIPTEQKISISGTAWIDEDEDGKRSVEEDIYSNMQVMLYDSINSTFIKENGQNKIVQTDENGEYEFNNLEKGQYIVVFLYNTDEYKVTQYQSDEVIDSKNNDVITKTIGIDGMIVTAGLTDMLNADTSLRNIDIGLIKNKDFDLELKKFINKITVQTNDGKTKTYTYDNKQLAKVEIHSKKLNGATVIIEYKMVVTNKGEISGKVAEIVDNIPSGLNFKSELNQNWYEMDGKLYTNSLLEQTLDVGESEEISLILTKEINNNNIGTVVNTASIEISNNDNAIEDINSENDSSEAQVIIGVSTGLLNWLGTTIGILVVLSLLAILIWKNRKILKGAIFISIFAICLIGNAGQVFGASFGNPDEYITIWGVFDPNDDSHMLYAFGSDGYVYYCDQKGLKFCRKPHGAKLIKHKITYSDEKWEDVNVEDIVLTDKTNYEKVTFSKIDDDFNKVGPFKINSSNTDAKYTAEISYKNNKGEVKTFMINEKTKTQLIDFKWNEEFYIKLPKSIVQIDKLTINASYEVTQTGTRKEKHYYLYNTWQLDDDDCVSVGETQNMEREESKIVTTSRTIEKSKSLDIKGPWTITGDIKLEKVDSKNKNTKLKDVVFIMQQGSSSKKYMTVSKNNKKIDRIEVNTIELLNNSTTADETKAKVNGVGGYIVQFNETKNNATKLVTNKDGNIIIKNLKWGTYTFTEIENGNYGYTKFEKETANIDKPLNENIITIKNEKQVGELNLKKVDEQNKDKTLANVEFVIKSSLHKYYIKVKATGNKSIKTDDNGWATRIIGASTVTEIEYTNNKDEATRFVTNAEGKISVKNLVSTKDGTEEIKYNIVEVYNPNPLYNAKYESGYISLGTAVIEVENHQEYINLEGYVWEEISNSKNNSTNNLYNNTDALVKGIKVKLCKDSKVIKTATTDSNGKYKFEKIKVEDLDKYYIEFEYDGLRFTTVKANTIYTSKNYSSSSKATEVAKGRSDRKDRLSVNSDFAEITNGKSRNNGKEVYTLNYNFSNHVSTYKDHWGYEYNRNKTKLTVTQSKDYVVVASTSTSEFNLKSAWKAQVKDGEDTLTGINLGIKRREQVDLAISTDISSVNVLVQNYENTYTYENRQDYEDQNLNDKNYDAAKDGFGTEVKFGSKYSSSYSNKGLKMYTRRIYESDLALYNNSYENNTDLMQIYVTYKITVKNQSNGLKAIVNELANYYDSRYVIEDSWIINGKTKKQIGAEGWSNISKYENSYNKNGYIAGYINATSKIAIEANGKIEVYIKFKLKPEAVKALIEKQTTLNNISEITSFSAKTVEDGKLTSYASIDEDSNPGSIKNISLSKNTTTKVTLNGRTYEIETKTLNEKLYEDDTDSAPSLVLGIEEEEPTRGLSGTVFEDEDALHKDDNTYTGEERLGDGILHTDGTYKGKGKYEKIDTNRVSGVKVELLEYDENTIDHIAKDAKGNVKVATLYKLKVNESGVLSTTKEKAETKTDNKGEYIFTGIIPGRYLIRYTYDNNCYIIDKDGKQIEQVNVRDYKSTIVTSDIIKSALNLSQNDKGTGDLNWILKYDNIPNNNKIEEKNKSKDLSGLIRYSGAIDDVSKRDEMDDLYYGSYVNTYEMKADTAFFDVGVEYSEIKEENGFANKVSYTDYKDEYQLKDGKILILNDEGKLKVVETFYAVNPYQDFGISERARQDYEINKRISNLKITLANGQVLIEGNPYKQLPENPTDIDEYWNNLENSSGSSLPYVKALPGQIVAEIDNEIIQGAILNIEYTITIRNKSEKDYKCKDNQDYYYYGKNGQEETSTAIRKIVDYMSDDLAYDDEKNSNIGWVKVQASDLYNWTKDTDNNNKQLISYDVNEAVKQGYTIAVTEYFSQPGQTIEAGKIGDIKIYGNKVLSASEKGTDIKNHVEIIETMGVRSIKGSTPGNYNPTTREPNEPDDDLTSLAITPPTGLSDNRIQILVITVVVLICLACGICMIKKKYKSTSISK